MWVLLVGLTGCGREEPAGDAAAPTYVDPAACFTCHRRQERAWRGSDHALAMQPATDETVLADFDGTTFEKDGVVTSFSRRDGRFFVTTDGPDGALREYPVPYTFGVRPLQQYLVDVGRGRLQALSVCWDVERRRWFHLHDEPVPHDDPLHWTGRLQNWNYMCAECHSTELRLGYDARADVYHTTWEEIDVGCQGCHGPGSAHVAWAEARKAGSGRWTDDEDKGLVAPLDDQDPRAQLETCARCHSRRSVVADGWRPGSHLLDHYELALLTEPLYHADGQILDEVYVYGSFLQSAMHAHGVRCTDCHDPHAARVVAEGNALCVRCHGPEPDARFPTLPAKAYDGPEHHHHEAGSAGAACVACHMPARPYMQVDPRRDHSFRIPRPDLSVAIGVPNACGDCHAEREPAWAAEQVRAWFPRGRAATEGSGNPAVALAGARLGLVEAVPALIRLATDPERPAILRATATHELALAPRLEVLTVLVGLLEDPEALVRAAAVEAVGEVAVHGLPPAARPEVLARVAARLADERRLVRVLAVRVVAEMAGRNLPPEHRAAFDAARGEYEHRQEALGDRPDGPFNLGVMHDALGEPAQAEAAYRASIARDPRFVPARMNLAALLSAAGRPAEAEEHLRAVVLRWPEHGDGWYALGLLLAELDRPEEAEHALRRAADLLPRRGRVRRNLGLLLQLRGRLAEAEVELRRAVALDPRDPDALHALGVLQVERGELPEARAALRALQELAPPLAQDLARRIEAAGR